MQTPTPPKFTRGELVRFVTRGSTHTVLSRTWRENIKAIRTSGVVNYTGWVYGISGIVLTVIEPALRPIPPDEEDPSFAKFKNNLHRSTKRRRTTKAA